ncbi:L-aspartate oxidase [Microbacterium sp. EF45047]|uniref:L-aspartate oxidase n=1 Tax=Microbacterium sp. EF45047 TaxID=2809708 RepID=UPI00234BD966|nr:L-aspartate oxidase [Microbacterium sp. EF45047]WCM56279.1 L-aspartate oxidase [Microbacterium sp. EF45047]
MRILVAGGGIAGLSTALLAAARGHEVELLVKGALGDGCTPHAQGGIAGVYGPGDSPALHALDTAHAGDGLGDPVAIAALVDGASAAVRMLAGAGVVFDRAADGSLARGLEAAHSRPRIAHAGGDATGRAVSTALTARVREARIRVREHAAAADLLAGDGRVHGIRLLGDGIGRDGIGRGEEIEADAVVLATGGAGQLFAHTTNPAGTTGDGIAMALRAGAAVADLEFVQFHPTVLVDGGTGFLVSEAVRGAGATLVDEDGRRFLLDEHPDAELAPRDVVARAVARRAAAQGAPVRLDATGLGAAELARRFPTIDREIRSRGWDWSREPVPVTPAAHYLMGGVVTDVDGRTSLPGLWAVGETARTGVHGANRLASNSLLEGAVFAARLVDALDAPQVETSVIDIPVVHPPVVERAKRGETHPPGASPVVARDQLQHLLWTRVGLLRTPEGLASAVRDLGAWRARGIRTVSDLEDANLLTVARAMASAALARTESVGAHHLDAPALIGAR